MPTASATLSKMEIKAKGLIVVTGKDTVGSCIVTWTPTVSDTRIDWVGTSSTGCKAKTGITEEVAAST